MNNNNSSAIKARIASTCIAFFCSLTLSPAYSANKIFHTDKLATNYSAGPEFEASFSVYYKNLRVAQSDWTLKSTPSNKYDFTAATKTVGLARVFKKFDLIEQSKGTWLGSGVIPSKYSYQRSDRKGIRETVVDFDWKNELLLASRNGSQWDAELKGGMQDHLSYILKLFTNLSTQNQHAKFLLKVANHKKVKIHEFSTEGHEVVRVNLNSERVRSIKTVKLARNYVNSPNKKTLVWCAPELNYLPVKAWHQTEDGAQVEAFLDTYKIPSQ